MQSSSAPAAPSGQDPAPLLLFTDLNRDPDDLTALVVATALHARGAIELACVVTALGDREMRRRRARLAKAVLETLGLPGVEVGVGGDYAIAVRDAGGVLDREATESRRADHQLFLDHPFVQPEGAVAADGLSLLAAALEQVPDRAALLLVIAGMTDLAALLRLAPGLVRRKAARVVIMGGIEAEPDERGFVRADRRAYNNIADQPAADFVHARLQELGVPLVVVTKEAAYAAAVTRGFYEALAATGHPVGVCLRQQQRRALANLWSNVRAGRLLPQLTPAWFFETFTGRQPDAAAVPAARDPAQADPDPFDAVWRQVTRLNLYDPIALLAATPGLRERLFRPRVPLATGGGAAILGEDAVTDPAQVRELLGELALAALTR